MKLTKEDALKYHSQSALGGDGFILALNFPTGRGKS